MKRIYKIMVVFISLFIFTNVVMASEPASVWRQKVSEYKNGFLFTSVDTYDSEYYYVGGINAEIRVDFTTMDNFTNSDYLGFVAKYDKDGNILWKKKADGVKNIYKVKGTSDGGFIALGENTTKPDGSDFTHSTLFKYDKDGNVEWKTELQTTSYLYQESGTYSYFNNTKIYNDDKGNYIILIGNDNINIVVVSTDGEVNRNFNTASLNDDDNTYLSLLSSTKDKDNYIVIFGTKYNKTSKEIKLVMYKFDTNGYLVSDKEVQNIDDDLRGLSVDTDINGNYVVALLNKKDNDYSFYFNVYDRNGKLISSKQADGQEEIDYGSRDLFKLDIDLENNYLVSFYSRGLFAQYRFSEDGTVNWNYLNGSLYALDFATDKYNNYIYVGGDADADPTSMDNSNAVVFQGSQYFVSARAYIQKMSIDYHINVIREGVGEVESSASTSKSGDTVTIKATPGEGYRIDKITVTDKFGNNIDVVDNKFVMPASDVTIKVIFTNAPIENPKTGTMDIVGASVIFILLGIAGYQYIKSKQMIGL